jgi:phage minor structural protein
MMPTLYAPGTMTFTTNGLGGLSDCISAKVVEERNGAFEMELTMPTSGAHFSDIGLGSIITAKPSPVRSSQPFEVYEIEKDMSGMIATVRCQHISYRLSLIPVMPFTAYSADDALQGLKTNSQETNPFTFWTDVTRTGTYNQKIPSSVKNRLQGEQGSILQTYLGEYEWDGYTVKLHAARGLDRGVQIRYGKNLTSLKQDQNIENTITGLLPYWTNAENGGVLVTLPEVIVYADTAEQYPFKRTVVMDFSSEFQQEPTEAQLRQKATQYIVSNNLGYPSINLDVQFAELSQTTDYADLALLERVELCDTVTIIFPDFNISTGAKVIKTDFDVLNERYNSIELGDPVTTLAATIASTQETVQNSEYEQRTYFQEALDRATALINGDVSGSMMKTITDANGTPQGLIIMDTNDPATAVNCIRINANGIGFSNNGIDGPYNSAWTIDNTLNMENINVIGMTANYLTTGTIQDKTHRNYWNLDTGEISIQATGVDVGVGARNYIRLINTLDYEGYFWVFTFNVNGEQLLVNGENLEVNI